MIIRNLLSLSCCELININVKVFSFTMARNRVGSKLPGEPRKKKVKIKPLKKPYYIPSKLKAFGNYGRVIGKPKKFKGLKWWKIYSPNEPFKLSIICENGKVLSSSQTISLSDRKSVGGLLAIDESRVRDVTPEEIRILKRFFRDKII